MQWKKIAGISVLGAAVTLGGCGTKSHGGSDAAPDSGSTVAARQVPGVGTALTDAAGKTLYFADQETDGTVHCVDACLRFWSPLTVSAGVTPTSGGGVTGAVSTVHRSDGSVQVTYDGKPLYTFVQDNGPGSASGNGFKDNFGGTNFSWHAAAVAGAVAPPSTAPTGAAGTDSGYGGYGY
jgi:predicted lipoprotein with Yx(FWY)xxD motif